MTGAWWLAVTCLGAAALVAGWPRRSRLDRWRLVTAGRGKDRPLSRRPLSRRPLSRRPLSRRPLSRRALSRRVLSFAPLLAGYRRNGRRSVLLVVVLAGAAGVLAEGPVAGFAAAAYGGLAARAGLRRIAVRETEQSRRRQLDGLCALAADLRAGLPAPALGPPAAAVGAGEHRLDELTRAAVRLAERTGAPLADLVERIEADARASARGLASAAAQAAGARATAWLLAALPAGGIALGYGIGVDPLRVLLHTPVGAACAFGAIVLQLAGLAWADRLSGGPVRVT